MPLMQIGRFHRDVVHHAMTEVFTAQGPRWMQRFEQMHYPPQCLLRLNHAMVACRPTAKHSRRELAKLVEKGCERLCAANLNGCLAARRDRLDFHRLLLLNLRERHNILHRLTPSCRLRRARPR